MDKEKVLKLAQLARIEISDSEAESLSKEFEGILNYVSDIKNVVGEAEAEKPMPGKENFALKNIMREDTDAHESGIHTEAILNEAPQRDGQYIKVKKIL
jgi:aspartyl-tRNA(Asn)/glutamyl-tRNA(Gln) amidotransferase subunit C